MKKILTLLIAVLSVGAAFSLNRSYDYRTNQQQNQYRTHDRSGTYSQNNGYYDQNNRYNNNRYDERQRRAEIDRINFEYNQRIQTYRNDRRMHAYERERRIREMEYERNSRLKSFGGGVVVGALATILLGQIFSH